MKVALMQPTFMPWSGYFNLIRDSEVFIFLDDFQFVRRSFHQRNRLINSNGSPYWLSLPITKSSQKNTTINTALPELTNRWIDKTLKTIEQTYKKSPFFGQYYSILVKELSSSPKSLAEININIIKNVCIELDITTSFERSSNLDYSGTKSAAIYALLKVSAAKTYLCAKGSFEYMREEGIFPVDGIEVLFQNYIPSKYNQLNANEFHPYLSIFDLLFNLGKEGTLKQLEHDSLQYRKWSEMLSS